MLIGIPNCQGRVSPVFDVATRLLLIRFSGRAKEERREVGLFEPEPAELVRRLRELGVEVLLCGAISRALQLALEHAGIRVRAQLCGELDPVLAAYCAGRLHQPKFRMPGCGAPKRRTPERARPPGPRPRAARRGPPTHLLQRP